MRWDWTLEPCREPAAVPAKPRPSTEHAGTGSVRLSSVIHQGGDHHLPSIHNIPKGRSAEHRHGRRW
ncbi:hypothetical protein J3E69DRAFT_351792 [Trichoderma sp. SZMC 28015]